MYCLFSRSVRQLPSSLNEDAFKYFIKQVNRIGLQNYGTDSFLYLHDKVPNCVVLYNKQKAIYLPFLAYTKRYKFKKPPKVADEDRESDTESEDNQTEDPSAKAITGRMLSLRVDAVLKTGLGLARNKVETLFYENKILVNGEKINKKSAKLGKGDEVDVIKGNMNNMINVSRIVILSAEENDNNDGLIVKMKRYKHLTIENQEM